ncbi:MAG: DUF1990 domain-containing protein [Candidatus Sulfotelmatobacter sp.]|jgi:uncharacterized protein (UPF0548 family)
MFLLTKPNEARIRRVLAEQRASAFSYAEVGATRGALPDAYAVQRGRVDLGHGAITFAKAVQLLMQWKMFEVPGIRLCWPDVPLRSGESVAVLVKHFGLWSINCCRIVYVIDEHGPIRRFGFAYGTLAEHAERGEERFTVEWERASDVVGYEILSFSRPRSPLAKAGYAFARRLQRRFLRQSLAAMTKAVGGE